MRNLPLLAVLAALPAAAQAPRSVYTTLGDHACRTLSVARESGGSLRRCPGTGGFALQVADDDDRMSVNVVAPGGRVHELNYWSVVTGNFSSVGPRAEWRVRGARPYALIVRVNASEDPVHTDRITSYLAVARVGPRESCVVAIIRPSADANARARQAADASAGRSCLGERR